MKSYSDLAAELEGMVGSPDPERAHIEADDILTAVIARAALTQKPPTRRQSEPDPGSVRSHREVVRVRSDP